MPRLRPRRYLQTFGKWHCEDVLDIAKNSDEHRLGELACESVLLARMVRREELREAVGKWVTRAVAKGKCGKASDLAALFEQAEISAHGNAPQYENCARTNQLQLALEVGTAVGKLGWQGLIRGRGATKRGRHVSILEREAVSAMRGCGLICKSGAMERFVKKIAGAVAGEHASGAICAMRGGGEAQD